MTELIVLLRGINVGRANRISMADLRGLLAALGYGNPRTLLQSGNAVVDVTAAQAATAVTEIHGALRQAGVTSSVITRTGAEFRQAVAANPLTEIATDGAKHLIGFLDDEPSAAAAAQVDAIDLPPDAIKLIGRHVYLWMTEGVLNSRLSKSGWEKMLGTAVTARNMNTVVKLEAMLTD